MEEFMRFVHLGLIASALLIMTAIPNLSYGREAGRFQGGERPQSENFNRAGQYHPNQDRRAYDAGFNQGSSNSGGGGGTYVQPNSSFEQLEQYANPNSAVNQNFQYNQRQNQGQQ